MIAQVGAPLEMGARLSFDSRDLKEVPMFGGGECQGFFEQRPQRAPEPIVRGNIETDLLPCEYRRTEFPAHQVPQDYFLP